MSRIGRQPITLPEKVTLQAKDGLVEVSGPLGKLTQRIPAGITVTIDKNVATVDQTDKTQGSALHGLSRSLINNAVTGVTKGFKKELEIVGLGYRAAIAGDKLTLTLGFAHPVV